MDQRWKYLDVCGTAYHDEKGCHKIEYILLLEKHFQNIDDGSRQVVFLDEFVIIFLKTWRHITLKNKELLNYSSITDYRR